MVGHLIVSERLALPYTGADHPAEAAKRLFRDHRQVAGVTCGAAGCWVASGPDAVYHQPAYPVEVVDTTGCGDVFHGAYAMGLATGMPLHERIQFAAATAALKATQVGIEGVPGRGAVLVFLADMCIISSCPSVLFAGIRFITLFLIQPGDMNRGLQNV